LLSDIKILVNNNDVIEEVLINTKTDEIVRKVTVHIGKEMVVKPINKRKLKHRDRRVIINKIIDEGFKGLNASVKFSDTKRTGKVEVIDLDDLV
jgi:hypothetical protein